jgi:hypothetical protein
MPMLEDVKKIAEKVTGWSRPKRSALSGLTRDRKASTFRFKDDGIIPNHPSWPLVLYRGAVRFPDDLDPAAVFEELFQSNGWAILGVMAFTITCIIIPASMKCWALPAATEKCSSADTGGAF